MVFKYTPLAVVLFSLQSTAAPITEIAQTSTTAPTTAAAVPLTPTANTSATAPAQTIANAPAVAAASESVSSSAPTSSTQGNNASAVSAQKSETPSAVNNDKAPLSALARATVLAFTPDQEARIGEVAKAYLLDHPEVLLEVSQKLQAQQREQQIRIMKAAVLANQDALLNDPSTPAYGPTDAKVALVEFFDYQCSFCAHQALILEALMQDNAQVRYVFKELPIFGARWPASMDAAETGLQIWEQKGAEVYLAYHNAVFAIGHNEGRLTQQDINLASAKAGKLKGEKAEVLDTLAQTDALAQNLGLQGTPGLIVMPVSGATVDNVTVIPGGASQEMLQTAISKANGQ